MIFARSITYGIDSKIYLIQGYLQNNIPWFSSNGGNLEDYQIRIYGRLYNNLSGQSSRPENYVNGNDYEGNLNSDKSSVQIAFSVKDREINSGQNTANVDIIFTVNVNEIYNNQSFETERVLIETQKYLNKCGYITIITGVKETIQDVFSDFDITGIGYEDQAPRWVYSFECEVQYENNTCKQRSMAFTADNKTITVDNNTITIDQQILLL